MPSSLPLKKREMKKHTCAVALPKDDDTEWERKSVLKFFVRGMESEIVDSVRELEQKVSPSIRYCVTLS
jgi:hypothetical protein